MIYPINVSFLKARINKIVTYTIGIRYVATLAFLGMPILLMAQSEKDSTLVRTVVVEQEYNPDVMDASKINIVPKVEEPTVTKKDIEYSREIIPASSYGAYQELLPFTLKDEQPDAKKGYARLGYGNRGLLDAKAYYLMDLSSKDELGITFSMDGRNEKLSSSEPYETEDWKLRYYRTKMLLDYMHRFNSMDLNVAGDFESDVFSYRPYNPDRESGSLGGMSNLVIPTAGKQHHTKAFVKFGLLSSDEDMPLRFNFHTSYLFFNRKYGLEDEKSNKEHILRLSGDVVGDINDEQHIGINVLMNNMFYSEYLSNYTTLDFNPYYLHEGEDWKVRLGAHVDLAFGHGKTFQASPDIHGEYSFVDSYLAYVDFKGKRILNDYRRLEELSPYYSPYLSGENLKNTYVPLDGTIGLKGSPFSGFWFNIFVGYQINKDDLCPINDLINIYTYRYDNLKTEKTKAFYLGVNLDYMYKDIVKLNFATTYYNWDSKEIDALLLKPELKLSTSIDIKIIDRLFFNLGYDYIKRPESLLYNVGIIEENGHVYTHEMNYQMDAVSNLSAGVTYDITKNFSAFVKGNNLLNKDYQYYYAYPAAKISFMGGVSLRF